jgi:hypothetical protein
VHQSSVLDFYNYIKKTGSISSDHSIYFFLWDYPDYLQAINSKNRLNVINLKKPALKILNEVKQIVKPISSKEDVMFENLNLLYKQLAHLNYTACFTETELDLIYKLKRFSDNKTLAQKCNISVATLKRRLKIIAEKCDNAKSKSEIINFLYENYVLIPLKQKRLLYLNNNLFIIVTEKIISNTVLPTVRIVFANRQLWLSGL